MKKKSLKEINAIESEMISDANSFLEQMAEPKYRFEVNPLEDIKNLLNSEKLNFGKKQEIVINKQNVEPLLNIWECTSIEEVEFKMKTTNIYPKDVKFIIVSTDKLLSDRCNAYDYII